MKKSIPSASLLGCKLMSFIFSVGSAGSLYKADVAMIMGEGLFKFFFKKIPSTLCRFLALGLT